MLFVGLISCLFVVGFVVCVWVCCFVNSVALLVDFDLCLILVCYYLIDPV